MKYFFCFAFSLVLFSACSKNVTEEGIENDGLIGKWKLTEQFVSPGIGGSWQPYSSTTPVIVEFTAGGDFIYTSNFPKANLQLNKYVVAGNSLNMSSTSTSNTDTWPFSATNTKLEMSVFVCYEGCAYRFIPN